MILRAAISVSIWVYTGIMQSILLFLHIVKAALNNRLEYNGEISGHVGMLIKSLILFITTARNERIFLFIPSVISDSANNLYVSLGLTVL